MIGNVYIRATKTRTRNTRVRVSAKKRSSSCFLLIMLLGTLLISPAIKSVEAVAPNFTFNQTPTTFDIINRWSGDTKGYNFTIAQVSNGWFMRDWYDYDTSQWIWHGDASDTDSYGSGQYTTYANGTQVAWVFSQESWTNVITNNDTVVQLNITSRRTPTSGPPSGTDFFVERIFTFWAGSELFYVKTRVWHTHATDVFNLTNFDFYTIDATQDDAYTPDVPSVPQQFVDDIWYTNASYGGFGILHLNPGKIDGFETYTTQAGKDFAGLRDTTDYIGVAGNVDIYQFFLGLYQNGATDEATASNLEQELDDEMGDAFPSISGITGGTYDGRNNQTAALDFTEDGNHNLSFTISPVSELGVSESNFTVFHVSNWTPSSYALYINGSIETDDTYYFAYLNSTQDTLDMVIANPLTYATVRITTPPIAVLTDVFLSAGPYVYDNTYIVTGNPAKGVTSGAIVEIYWDIAIGEDAQLLNSTTSEANGMWEVWFDLPEAIQGDHYIWAKDTSGPFYASSSVFTVDPFVDLSASSGLPGDDVDVEGHGFGDEAVVGIVIEPWTVTAEAVGIGTGTQAVFNLDYFPVVAASETIYVNAVPQTDIVDYTLDDATGLITFAVAPAAGLAVTSDYDRDTYTIEASTTYETDDLGAFTKTFDVPNFPYGPYTITATDDETVPNTDSIVFTLGASINVTPEEGNTGTRITVDGRGWTPTETITFTYDGNPAEVVDAAVVTVGSTGKFSADVIIPSMPGIVLGKADLTAAESGAVKGPASDKFEVLGLPEIEVSPTYGSPGATITVTGYNWTQRADTEVVLTLWGKAPDPVVKVADLVIVETESDGTFEDTFMSPAVGFVGYDVRAEDAVYHLYAGDAFKVGLIAMIINPTSDAAGTEVALTGIGFRPGTYNLTFGDILYEDHGTGVSGGEAISDIFYAPNVDPGTYDVTVVDEDENELSTMFTVTAVTMVTLDPAMAPNDYNMTIEGENFADKVGAVDFLLYNSTDDWAMDVYEDGAGTVAAATDIDGNFTGWWEVLPEADLSLGDYTINVTGPEDFLVQVNFSLVEARVDVAPRKALFDRGDTIQFNVKNDFDFPASYMKVWDPYDNLYWQTEKFVDWVKAAGLYTVPYYLQTSGMNPMTLQQDAPMGTWFWIFYETGTTQLVNGTFEVGPSSAAQVDEKLTELWGSIEDLTTNIDDITSEIDDDISALSGEIDDVVADVQDMVDDITADLAGELAQVAEDTEAAVGELEGAIGDIADAQNDLASELDAVSQDTTAAREAAEDAQTSAQGLTTLVYGAIGASLIAALAAIVSLMQISSKITGE